MRVSGTDPAVVTEIREEGPAAGAGVKVGDLIQTVDGHRLSRGVDFYVEMLQRQAGDAVALRLVRDGAAKEATVTLKPVPKPDGKRLALEHLGLTVADVKEEVARRFQLRRQVGVIVLGVEPRSPADQAGMQPGDLLVSMGPHRLADVEHVGSLLTNLHQGDPVDVEFWRERRNVIYGLEARLYAR
jgi:serine protease Do